MMCEILREEKKREDLSLCQWPGQGKSDLRKKSAGDTDGSERVSERGSD